MLELRSRHAAQSMVLQIEETERGFREAHALGSYLFLLLSLSVERI